MPFKTNYCLFTQSTGQQQPIVDEQICFLAEQIDQLFTTGWTSANLKPTAEQQTILNLVEPLTTDHTDVVIRVKDILTTTPNSLKAIYALYDVAYWDNYQAWINWIIRAHNVTNLIAIWSLIYHHDRANPDFDSDILVACDYADLKTFVYVFYGFHCFARVNQSESNFDVADLKWQMKDNPHKAEIEAFLQKMIDAIGQHLYLLKNENTVPELDGDDGDYNPTKIISAWLDIEMETIYGADWLKTERQKVKEYADANV